MLREFEKKSLGALILGGSSGLGLATAKKLAKHGLNIIIMHRSRRSDLEQIETEFNDIRKENVKLLSFNVDALKEEIRKEIVAQIKDQLKDEKIKALVHSIAKGNLKPMIGDSESGLSSEDLKLTIDAMAISLFDWTKLIYQEKLFDSDSRIISFTSEGNQKPWTSYAAVSAAKTALEAITRNIALEFAPYGIKANCIQAGVTDTASLRMIPGHEKIIELALLRNPNHRLTTPEYVADAAYLLCKDEAKWITGTIIKVDGGEHLS